MRDGPDVVVISGGASGFGLALGTTCAARGMRVVLLDLDTERASDRAAELSDRYGVSVAGLGVDVSDIDSLERAADEVSERFGGADLVVSNVGVQLFGAVERFTDDEWRWLLDVNVIGSARMARIFLPLLRRSSHGRLAFTTSSSVLDPASRLGAYQASKFAVWGLAETLRLELRADGIRVSVIFPSGMSSRHLETSAAAQPEHVRRPIGEAEDFASMAESNPSMVQAVATPDEAAAGVLEALLVGEPYVITHGDLVGAVESRSENLLRAALSAG